jgi:hypothetical protein
VTATGAGNPLSAEHDGGGGGCDGAGCEGAGCGSLPLLDEDVSPLPYGRSLDAKLLVSVVNPAAVESYDESVADVPVADALDGPACDAGASAACWRPARAKGAWK